MLLDDGMSWLACITGEEKTSEGIKWVRRKMANKSGGENKSGGK